MHRTPAATTTCVLEPTVAARVAVLVDAQAGALTRRQALDAGMTSDQIRHRLRSGRWQRLMTGTYVALTGPVSPTAWTWAAVLYAGAGAMASHGSAAWLCGLSDEPPATVHVTVPACRRVPPPAGVTVHLSRHAGLRRHPARSLPQTTVEHTVLDLLDSARTAEAAVALVIRACQRRLTTAHRLRTEARGRSRLRWRGLLEEVLTEVAVGVHSVLERRWLRAVERPHGLPRGRRNHAEGTSRGRRYRDVDYDPWGVVVELDGRAAHPDEERHRDMARDNELAEQARLTLRYGWADIAGAPCAAAAQVVRTLRRQGWPGPPAPCGPDCDVTASA